MDPQLPAGKHLLQKLRFTRKKRCLSLGLCGDLETLHLTAPAVFYRELYPVLGQPAVTTTTAIPTTLTASFFTFNALFASMLSHVPPSVREITLEGPGAGGIETASAVVADLVSIVGTTGTGFLQGDPVWRQVERMPPGDLSSPWYLRLLVEDRAGVLARLAHELAVEGVSVARLVQQPANGHAVLHRPARTSSR